MKADARISDSTAAGPPAPTYDNLPDFPALARLKRDRKWVAWKYVPCEGKPKPDKLPVNPYSGGNAMVDTPATWGTYDQAVACARRDKLPGVGYVLTDDDKLTGVDLDQVRNVETGKLTPWAAEIVALAESYTEVSPSGTGLRIFSEGKIDAPIVNNPLSVEIYRKGRFLTITGQHLKGTPTDILPAPKTEAALRARVNGANVKPPPNFKNGHGKFDHEPSEWQKLNTAALQNLSAWVPEIFGDKAKYRSGIYRISSKALGRNLQEALSISPKGIKDFGVHDIGDPREGKRSPIDIVMKYGGKDFGEAVEWLREKLGRDKKSKSIHATPFEWVEPSKIPARQWLYKPHYIRQFVSATFSPGGLGKTSLLTVEVLAMVTNKPLLGIQPSQQLRVWYWNGEDPMQELQRRFAAACKHYDLTKDDIGDHLFIDSGRTMPIVIAEDTRTGTRIAEPVIEEVIATIRERQIDVLIVDPFISCHRVNENDNAAIERVAKSWGDISEVTNCSISLAHHVRKGKAGEAVTVEDGRGASALRDAVRTARTLNNMSAREAEDAEINESARLFYFRVDIGKRRVS